MEKPVVWGLAALVVVSSAGLAHFGAPSFPGLAYASGDGAAAHGPRGHDAHEHGDAPRVAKVPGEGAVPTLADAALSLDRRNDVVIAGDAQWTPAAGIRGGSGTPEDPFTITGYFVDTILIKDTSKCFEIAGNYVANILVLDWTGSCGLVHHNHVNNLRTNRNVERIGDATGAVIVKNDILRVQELRHFDGVLADNVIGDEDEQKLPGGGVVLNIAGLNGAGITRNVIWGGVDMKLHGHHHSGHHEGPSHNHGRPDAEQDEAFDEDHATRFIEFLFAGNTIHSDAFGLRYNDLDHAGDDRTATSEQEPTLELPHTHHTTIRIAENVIEGAGLRVSVFNAQDERHLGSEGTVLVENNTIKEPLVGDAVTIHDVRNATVIVRGNVVEKPLVRLSGGSGIYLLRFHGSNVLVEDNTLPGFTFGVRAREFCASTTWLVKDVRAPGARNDVYWDETVPNPPTGEKAGADANADANATGDEHAGHNHGDAAQESPAPRGDVDAALARVPSAVGAP